MVGGTMATEGLLLKFSRDSSAMIWLILVGLAAQSVGQVLTPPYFNLAVGRPIEATATCGIGVSEPELFCKLTGANPDKEDVIGDFEVIQGQLCDRCDRNDATKTHSPEFAVDGTERWWQSPPLSRGLQFNQINLTIHLQQEFHVAYVFIKMGNSPRPGVFALERSTDHGKTWRPWQFFADTPSDCNTFFGHGNYSDHIVRDDSVICTTEYSKVVPLEGGEIVVSLVNNRPSSNNFSYSLSLQDWTKATDIRLRLLRTKTLLGHLMAVARQDPTVTRRYYYSIKDISIGGQCVCNGHADDCDRTDPVDTTKLVCRCQHNTCGQQCEICCPGFVQKPWRPATLGAINECEPCQCHGHSRECEYDPEVDRNRSSIDIHGRYEGGGVCINCQHNTVGINCEKCRPGFYRPYNVPINSTRACRRCSCDTTYSTGNCLEGSGQCQCKPQYAGVSCDRCNDGYYSFPRCIPCQCHINGTQGRVCEVGGGQCPCKPNFDGINCDQCAFDYYNFPQCQPCDCDSIGSHGGRCDVRTGQCTCRPNYSGRNCGSCAPGFYNYPACDRCSCDRNGATAEVCDKDYGQCICKENFSGSRCERCAPGYFNWPHCISCGCSEIGMQSNTCDSSGQCHCKRNFHGAKCDQCAVGFYKYPECLECRCDVYGSYGIACDQQTGQCDCAPTFEGLTCNRCRPNYYNYPTCEECSCDPAGAKEVPGYPLGGCGAHAGGQLCECKDRVGGRICDTCKPGFWNLNIHNPDGCEDCRCDTRGTNGGSRVCNVVTGQCVCKPFVNSLRCSECADGTYNLQESNVFGCQACNCDVGGSRDQNCDKNTGQCTCKPRVNGIKCESPIATHYFPTLFHIMYELEEGRTPSGGAVRYGFDSRTFPDYSWKGYAIFSKIQDEIVVNVEILKPSLYRIVYRFVNPSERSIAAEVTATPVSSTSDTPQNKPVTFPSAYRPELVTVSSSGISSAFVLNPGQWSISLKVPETLYVDYLVLLPQAYYEATILQEKVNVPCALPSTGGICKHFVYVNVSVYPSVRGETGLTRVGGSERDRTQLYPDRSVPDKLGVRDLAYLNNRQTSLTVDLPVRTPGKYIFVILYYSRTTGRMQELDVDVVISGGRDRGSLRLPGCPYSSLCRQAVIDSYGNPKEFTIDGSYATITINGRPDIDLAVDSIIAIPVNEWKIDFISPQLQCVRKDDQCVPGTYVTPAGTVRVDVESGNEHRVATDIQPYIIDTTIKVIKLDGSAPTVDVNAFVSSAGKYVLVGHYYQPFITGFDVDVYVNVHGQTYKGTLETNFCPGVSGCRSVIKFKDVDDKMTLDLSDPNIRITFNSSRPVWLDYLMVIPSVQFNPKTVLSVQDVDQSSDFITKCGSQEFSINVTDSNYCRDAIFSLTTEYNNGALQCLCSGDGSLSFACSEFGGQCRCKPNVIGRNCTHCRTGYYGFPNCRRCACPSGLCDPRTGQCVCPPRVTGDNCDTCLPRTFGFDPLIGCEDCDCDQKGVAGGKTDCDVNSGQCQCKPGITGRRCNKCHAGYYGFPRCRECSCNRNGVTNDICDQRTATCLCKSNVDGAQCSECKSGTFYLEERNPKGCTQCFCFGITTRCESSNYRWSQIVRMDGWGLTNLQNPSLNKVGDRLEATHLRILDESEAVYWIAPSPYLGNHVTSYGGKLLYTVLFNLPRDDRPSKGEIHADVRIEGHEFTISHVAREQPVPGVPLTVEVDLLETKFEHHSTGAPVTREQFMLVLSRIRALHIRGSYYSAVDSIQLSDVRLDVASADGRGAEALNVEHCHCPPNYSGTSCEQCAVGYYRSKQGPYFGSCVPCQCNNRATSCDPDSGECQDCRDNFHGPQCLACKRGYYLNDYTNRCEICGCPLGVDSNNFASTCLVSSSGRVEQCDCLPGYAGLKCERCDVGYWGNPMRIGGSCRPCDCSGNIDLNDPQSCDVETGRCVHCLYNSGGERCERCKDWYYGDAIDLKSCRPCVCNTIGSELCDHQSGACLCKPNVVGATCDRCIPGTYGFDSGRGCELCNCGRASITTDCDIYSGQCQCQPGVTGRKCDQCEEGYWNYSPRGCQRCTCSSGATTCDKVTGQCQCLPGVTGPNCDQCLPRWIMIPGIGCQECDNCIHLLMDDVEFLDRNVTTMRRELDSISVGILAFQRLERINRTVAELRPQVDDLVNRPTDPSQLNPIKRELYEVQTLANEVSMKSDRTVRNSEVVESDASDVKNRAETIYRDLVQTAIREANDAVDFVKSILDAITGSIGSSNVDELLRQAEQMLTEIKSRDFLAKDYAARDELEKANEALRRAKELMDRANSQANRTTEISILLDDIRNKLHDLQNSSRHSMDNSQAASAMNARIRLLMRFVTETITKIRQMQTDVVNCIDRARKMLDKARQFLVDARQAYVDVERESSRLDAAIGDIRNFVTSLSGQNENLRPLVENATEHARQLQRHADNLDSLIANTRESSEAALNASNAYRAITDAITSALNASLEAIRVAEEAARLSHGLAADAKRSRERSESLKTDADSIADRVDYELRLRLENIKKRLDEYMKVNIHIRNQITELTIGLDNLPEGGFGEKAREAAERAMNAQQKAEAAEKKIKDIVDNLPEDQRKLTELSRDIDTANQNIRMAQDNVNNVVRLVPDVISLLDRLSRRSAQIRQLGLDLKANISLLRNNVSAARDQANLITVGVSFDDDTSLQVRNPRNLMSAGAYSRVSIYFRTEEKNGLLFFAGPNSTQTKVDYLSLQIIDGKAVFKFDLGSGAAIITNPKDVSDGKWHEAIMERTGRIGNLTIRTQDEVDEVVGGESLGASSVLDFDHYTQLFIGGIPDNAVHHLREILQFTRFQGCIEDIKFDGVAIGLWNFVTAKAVKGCNAREVLQEAFVNGYMFGGNGYVILAKDRFSPGRTTLVKFSFRTFASEGLMFLMGTPNRDFFSLELKDGKVVFQFELGSGRATLPSSQRYNDGKWHVVIANRMQQDGLLKVDGNSVSSGRSPGNLKDLDTDDFIYVGGFKGTHTFSNANVTQKGFEGCIKDIRFGATDRNINEHLEAKDVLRGCPEMAVVRVVSFAHGQSHSYIAVDPVNIGDTYEMTMKFKTLEKDGLLFYAANEHQTNGFSLSLRNGRVVVMNVVENLTTSLESREDNYSDGVWHYLTVTKDRKDLSLHIDDTDFVTTKLEGLSRTQTTLPLYFGGLPSNFIFIPQNFGSHASFVGCIGDVTIRQRLVDFGVVQSANMTGAILSSCPIPDPTPPLPQISLPTRQPFTYPPTVLPPDRCKLPLEPSSTPEEIETGYRFGSKPGSRLEYASFPSSNTNRAEYRVDFRTLLKTGVIFYVASQQHVDFVAIYIKDGFVNADFNCGGGTARMTSRAAYSDGEWHTLVFNRNLQHGTLTVDGGETVNATAPGASNSIEVNMPYYVGGLPVELNAKAISNLNNVTSGFVGCLRNFMQDGREIGDPDREESVQQCSPSHEFGTFFYSDGGHLVLADNFSVGLDFEINLQIRPRTLSGVLLSVHNRAEGERGDYLVLQMVDGNVVFGMDNGRGPVKSIYQPPAKNLLCDGNWHSIYALKAKNVVTLKVDGVYTSPGLGEAGFSRTNTADPLYLGGVPERHRGIETSESFVGCIRHLELDKKAQDISLARVGGGNVDLHSCPSK